MNRPEDIPEDIWNAAYEASYVGYWHVVEKTARAIMAERERCIRAATQFVDTVTAEDIAAAIRLPTPPHTGKE